MAEYQIKGRGVRRDTGLNETLERSLHSTDDQSAMEAVAVDYAPSIRDEYISVESLELYSSANRSETVAVYDMTAKKWLVGNIPSDERPIFSGYNRTQLSEAFDKVRNPENWKMAIDTVLPADLDQALTGAAIAFFAGSEATFDTTADGIRVTAAGYYADVGA